jgi:hypothetical protein
MSRQETAESADTSAPQLTSESALDQRQLGQLTLSRGFLFLQWKVRDRLQVGSVSEA